MFLYTQKYNVQMFKLLDVVLCEYSADSAENTRASNVFVFDYCFDRLTDFHSWST